MTEATEAAEPVDAGDAADPDDAAPGSEGAAVDEVASDEVASAEVATDAAVLEITQRSADAQARCDAGDYDGAIALWSELLAEVPRTAEQAPRRASFLLAIVDAHEWAYLADRDPRRLRVAIELIDRYLGELAPTDDENRVAVEARRQGLVARLAASSGGVASGADDSGPRAPTPEPVDHRALGRRWVISGGVITAAGVGGLALMGMGMVLGRQADVDLTSALALPITDANREAARDAAVDDGVLANRLAYAGGILGGALIVSGAAAILRGRRLRLQATPGPTALGVGLGGAF
ncbi:MAG: hypothetical protein R3A79_23765 [Nannocystaceae bacterium]